jgi:hypothetical protein
MTYLRRAYDDAATTDEMSADCREVAARLRRPAPSIRYEDQPREVRKPRVEVDEAAARLAAALGLTR